MTRSQVHNLRLVGLALALLAGLGLQKHDIDGVHASCDGCDSPVGALLIRASGTAKADCPYVDSAKDAAVVDAVVRLRVVPIF